MKTKILTLLCLGCSTFYLQSQSVTKLPALVDFDAYENLMKEVKVHRSTRLISLDTFLNFSQDSNTVILDTRSDSMYKLKHVKGAIHLDFTDFTQAALNKLIPNKSTRILIYCNNNFRDVITPFNKFDYFVTKSVIRPEIDYAIFKTAAAASETTTQIKPETAITNKKDTVATIKEADELTLALNIPTYINLYGYGFRNVFELSQLVFTDNTPLQFEGTFNKE